MSFARLRADVVWRLVAAAVAAVIALVMALVSMPLLSGPSSGSHVGNWVATCAIAAAIAAFVVARFEVRQPASGVVCMGFLTNAIGVMLIPLSGVFPEVTSAAYGHFAAGFLLSIAFLPFVLAGAIIWGGLLTLLAPHMFDPDMLDQERDPDTGQTLIPVVAVFIASALLLIVGLIQFGGLITGIV